MSTYDDDVLDGALRELLERDAVWATGAPSDADAIVAAIAAERAPARPSRARAWLGPIAAGIAAAALTIAVSAVVFDDDPAQEAEPVADVTVTMTPSGLVPDAAAVAAVTARPLGTVIRLDAAGIPPAAPGTYYEAWMRTDADAAVSAGTFHMRGGDGTVYLWSGVAVAEYPVLTVTLQHEGDVTPSGAVVLRARLD